MLTDDNDVSLMFLDDKTEISVVINDVDDDYWDKQVCLTGTEMRVSKNDILVDADFIACGMNTDSLILDRYGFHSSGKLSKYSPVSNTTNSSRITFPEHNIRGTMNSQI